MLIAITIGLMTLFNQWPTALSVGHFVLIVSSAFLLQTLIRDLVLLYHLKRHPNPSDQKRDGQCFCIESVVGTVVLLLGIVLFSAGIGTMIYPAKVHWLAAMLPAMLINYWLRDFVFSWKPFKIYRDPNHLNIVPRF